MPQTPASSNCVHFTVHTAVVVMVTGGVDRCTQ